MENTSGVLLLVKHARDAFADERTIAAQWHDLNFTAAPDFARALDESDRFFELIRRAGGRPHPIPAAPGTSIDSIYVRDASVVCSGGAVLCHMGKPQRRGERSAQAPVYRALGIPILGEIEAPGTLEGGDVAWLGDRTLAVGRGYRTNDSGIEQLRMLVAGAVDDFIVVPLPHWRGPRDVFHLMSIISPIDRDLAVVYSPLLPVPFRETLIDRGITLVEVTDEEFETMGANVLAVTPRKCLMVAGNPRTRARLEHAGAEVFEYSGLEISLKGGGGPTCLTQPLASTRALSRGASS